MMNLSKYAKMIEWSLKTHNDCKIFESLSPNQISSKKWLTDELIKHLPNNISHKIEIVGSWYGFPLLQYIHDAINFEKIECWDIDKEARLICKKYIEIFKYDNIFVYNKNYWEHERTASEATLLINTSSEHMSSSFYQTKGKYGKFYHKNPLVVIQSNNMNHIEGHINCVNDEEELIIKHGIKDVLYAGNQNIVEWNGIEIIETKYKRFMIIGKL